MIDLNNVILDHEKTITLPDGTSYIMKIGDVYEYIWKLSTNPTSRRRMTIDDIIRRANGTIFIRRTVEYDRNSSCTSTDAISWIQDVINRNIIGSLHRL